MTDVSEIPSSDAAFDSSKCLTVADLLQLLPRFDLSWLVVGDHRFVFVQELVRCLVPQQKVQSAIVLGVNPEFTHAIEATIDNDKPITMRETLEATQRFHAMTPSSERDSNIICVSNFDD